MFLPQRSCHTPIPSATNVNAPAAIAGTSHHCPDAVILYGISRLRKTRALAVPSFHGKEVAATSSQP